jgi:hypothetical protein
VGARRGDGDDAEHRVVLFGPHNLAGELANDDRDNATRAVVQRQRRRTRRRHDSGERGAAQGGGDDRRGRHAESILDQVEGIAELLVHCEVEGELHVSDGYGVARQTMTAST